MGDGVGVGSENRIYLLWPLEGFFCIKKGGLPGEKATEFALCV